MALRLHAGLGRGEVLDGAGRAREMLPELFRAGRPLVCVMALGIVVRLLGPHLRAKQQEPPVVVVDEAGRFAVSVLGGHQAGGNDLTREVAHALGAAPVVTTASDVLGLPAVDLVGQSWGWRIAPDSDLTQVAAAVVRGEPVAVWQECGRSDWWTEWGDWPATFQRVASEPGEGWAAALIITDRCCRPAACPRVIYRPPSLVLGVGCRRGVCGDDIEEAFQRVCQRHGWAAESLGLVATATLKAGEPGLRDFVARHGVELRCFTLEELAAVGNLPTPSETVRRHIGVGGVAEPAAMLAAGTAELVVPKQICKGVTVALARRTEV
ncbi:MAG: cobalamin biosynthesis protein [Gemmataceae bacterium]|nr:cobalamin biosynthesis protein [Gemmataceae bacterium]MDW8266417.1 cobalamin biosynthesis protein [Gemmataceae bacterium]